MLLSGGAKTLLQSCNEWALLILWNKKKTNRNSEKQSLKHEMQYFIPVRIYVAAI